MQSSRDGWRDSLRSLFHQRVLEWLAAHRLLKAFRIQGLRLCDKNDQGVPGTRFWSLGSWRAKANLGWPRFGGADCTRLWGSGIRGSLFSFSSSNLKKGRKFNSSIQKFYKKESELRMFWVPEIIFLGRDSCVAEYFESALSNEKKNADNNIKTWAKLAGLTPTETTNCTWKASGTQGIVSQLFASTVYNQKRNKYPTKSNDFHSNIIRSWIFFPFWIELKEAHTRCKRKLFIIVNRWRSKL